MSSESANTTNEPDIKITVVEPEKCWLVSYQWWRTTHRSPDPRFHNFLHKGSLVDWLMDVRRDYGDEGNYHLVSAIEITKEEYERGRGYIG